MKLLAAALLLLSLASCGPRSIPIEAPAPRLNTELQRDRKSLIKVSNPVKRVKILIRISDALLGLVRHAASAGDLDTMKSQLHEYTEAVGDGHKTMQDTGRNARSKSDGFLDLELAMRRQLRDLENIGGTLGVTEREPVNQAIASVSTMRNSILEALMGGRRAPVER